MTDLFDSILTRSEKEALNAEYLQERIELQKLELEALKKKTVCITKKKVKSGRTRPMFSFVPDPELAKFLKGLGNDGVRSRYVNSSIRMMQRFNNNPLELMKMLKLKYPEQWKFINRRRFLN